MSWTLESANNAFLEVREEAVRKREAVDALDKSRTSNHRISKKFELWKLCFYVCVTDIFFAPFVILRSLRLWNSFLRIICVEPTCQGSWHSHAKSGRVKCGPGVSRSSMDLTIWSFFSFVPPVPCHLFSFVFICFRLWSFGLLLRAGYSRRRRVLGPQWFATRVTLRSNASCRFEATETATPLLFQVGFDSVPKHDKT